MTDLSQWGLTTAVTQAAARFPGMEPARIIEQQRGQYQVICEAGALPGAVSGKFMFDTQQTQDYPAIGDWVVITQDGELAVIHGLLPRISCFCRRAAGRSGEAQVVAANIDSVLICMAFNQDYNLRRLERYLSLAWESGATPVVVLTKADLCSDAAARQAEVRRIALGAEVLLCSNSTAQGYDQLLPLVSGRRTIAFIGSSGVGKSTLINYLAGEAVFRTNDIREDGRGRHTTTHRQMLVLPRGCIVIDTPGMRELGMESADFVNTFADIETLLEQCRFSNCTHHGEPGCAVAEAIADGRLDADRFANYRKLQTEVAYNQMDARQIEDAKITRMFGSKHAMKQQMKEVKNKNHRR